MIWGLLTTVGWGQDVSTPSPFDDVGFATEPIGLGSSAGLSGGSGLLVELIAQTLVLPAGVSTPPIDVVPVIPRLSVGAVGGDSVRWSATAHGVGAFSLDGVDWGWGAGISGGMLLGSPDGVLWTGLNLDAGLLSFRQGELALQRITVGLDAATSIDFDATSSLQLRFGGVFQSLPEGGTRLEPRLTLGAGYRPQDRTVLSLAVRGGLRQVDPRLPFTVLAGLALRFGPDPEPPPPPPVVPAPAPFVPVVDAVVHPDLTCEVGDIAVGSPPPYGTEAWCVHIADGLVVRQGVYLQWHTPSQRATEGQYESGERTGMWRSYSPEGVLLQEGRYVGGLEEGSWQAWRADGSILSTGLYVQGLREGEWHLGTPTGGRTVGHFRGGRPDGVWLEYDPRGREIFRKVYRNGALKTTETR